jgi:hypothetical protein
VPHRVLVACEYSARVRDAFRAQGHDAWSCDLIPTDGDPRWHVQADVLTLTSSGDWDCLVAFPPCTDLSSVGARSWAVKQADGRQQRALAFVQSLMDAPIPHVAIENPQGKINTSIRKPSQTIHPWQFGDPWTKRTCLWLKNLPLLVPDDIVEPTGYWVSGASRTLGRYGWRGEGAYAAVVAHGGKVGKWADMSHDRDLSFPGIARAMASQWGSYLDQVAPL